jgi:excisionase family DNA binding protein
MGESAVISRSGLRAYVERVSRPASPDRLLSVASAAEQLGTSPPALTAWINEGKVQAIRLPSNRLRVRQSEVDRCHRDWLTC